MEKIKGAGIIESYINLNGDITEEIFIRPIKLSEKGSPMRRSIINKIPPKEGWNIGYKAYNSSRYGRGYYYYRIIKQPKIGSN